MVAGRYNQYENHEVLGSLISEDIDYPPIEWTRELIVIKVIMEEYGLTIIQESDYHQYLHTLVRKVVRGGEITSEDTAKLVQIESDIGIDEFKDNVYDQAIAVLHLDPRSKDNVRDAEYMTQEILDQFIDGPTEVKY